MKAAPGVPLFYWALPAIAVARIAPDISGIDDGDMS